MARKKIIAAAALATVATAGVGTAATAMADGSGAPSATSTSPSSASGDKTDDKAPGRHQHTEVTGTEADNVKKAVTAKYSGVTVERVMKDADGSYDVMATKSGSRVMYEVSKDLKTVTEHTGRPGGPGMRGDHGGPGAQGDGSSGSSSSPSTTSPSTTSPAAPA